MICERCGSRQGHFGRICDHYSAVLCTRCINDWQGFAGTCELHDRWIEYLANQAILDAKINAGQVPSRYDVMEMLKLRHAIDDEWCELAKKFVATPPEDREPPKKKSALRAMLDGALDDLDDQAICALFDVLSEFQQKRKS